MKPYLILYLQSYYSLTTILKNRAKNELYYKLNQFQKFNPQFGRKRIKLGYKILPNFTKKAYIKCYEFNDKHIAFNAAYNCNFLTNHLNFEFDETNETDSSDENISNTIDFIFNNNLSLFDN